MDRSLTLVVLPSLPARRTSGGRVVITRKFLDGILEYLKEWNGPIAVFMEPIEDPTSNLDEIEVDPARLPFHLEVISYGDESLGDHLAGHRVALCTVSSRQNHLPSLCRSIGLPCVYVSEFSLKTRLQIIRAAPINILRVLKRSVEEVFQEIAHRRAIRLASGIQCNGTPTFEAYRPINRNPFLYFDSRVSEDMLATREELEARGRTLNEGGPLRLIFSGRLIHMKGADHLIAVADGLRKLGVPFRMTICGDGELAPWMKAEIARRGLGDLVVMAGNLDFKGELLPFTKREADVFVSCHLTGDPSCTQLEVMSCGVPLVGYANEAFRGLVQESGVGWLAKMGRPQELAERIAALEKDRGALLDAAYRALEFSRRWTFDQTFKARIEHLRGCLDKVEGPVGAEPVPLATEPRS